MVVAACWVGVWTVGCGVPATPESAQDSSPDGASIFAEDDDPATAALPYIETELLVQPYPGAPLEALKLLYQEVGATVIDELPEIDLTVLAVPEGTLDAAAEAAIDSGLIEEVHKNYILQASAIPDDPLFVSEDHLTQADVPDAWDVTVGADDVAIAIVDTGVDPDHPDLADKIIDGWNIYDNNADFADSAGHGTKVAGVAAAISDNNLGVAGVTWDSPIIVVRVSDDDGKTTARHVAAGILWALGRDARVINVSFAPLWSNRVVRAAATRAYNAGALVVISAGNDGGLATASGYAEAIFVGAVNGRDQLASFSDAGPFVDVVAPGIRILSTAMGGAFTASDGTSFAAPIVSGIAALAWSVNPDLRPGTIQSAIIKTAVDLGDSGKDDQYGFGAVRAAAAVQQALRSTYLPDTGPPKLTVSEPDDGDLLSGRPVAKVSATDDWGVADVTLSIDGVAVATDRRRPYRFVIDTSAYNSGAHELSFVATDHAGNASGEKTVSVTFGSATTGTSGNSPIEFTSPASGASITGDVTIKANIRDKDGLSTIEWLIDGESVFVATVSGTSSSISYKWRTTGVSKGTHTITLVVIDSDGDVQSASLSLNKK